jgi:tubulin-specific chaperone A
MIKEVAYYHKEVQENEATLEQMKQDGKDAHDIKKFEEVLGESYMMIPDSTSRLTSTLQDLATYVASDEVTGAGDFDMNASEWYSKAKEVLEAEKDRLKDMEGDVPETSLEGLNDGEAF